MFYAWDLVENYKGKRNCCSLASDSLIPMIIVSNELSCTALQKTLRCIPRRWLMARVAFKWWLYPRTVFKANLNSHTSLTNSLFLPSAGSEKTSYAQRPRWLASPHSSPVESFKPRASTLGSTLLRASVNNFLDRRRNAASFMWTYRILFSTQTSRSLNLVTNV